MVEKEKPKREVAKKVKDSLKTKKCGDQFCPIHGIKKLKLRGRVFRGEVVKKLHGRVSIQFERTIYIRKYERYEKGKTKLHARLPECLEDGVNVGDLVEIAETRPLSKMIHFVVTKLVRKKK